VQKYGNVDVDVYDIWIKLDAIKQEPKERVQKYYERMDKLFQRGQIQNVQQHRRFLGKLRPEIRKLWVVKAYIDIDEVVVTAIKIKRVLGELRETPYEPMKEEQDETMSGKSTTDCQLHLLNETLINFFGKGTNAKVGPNTSFSFNTHNRCQLCRSEEHIALACPKLTDTRPKCAKCRGGHKTNNCGLKCSFCLRLRHMEERC
jgi:hypothetical protein